MVRPVCGRSGRVPPSTGGQGAPSRTHRLTVDARRGRCLVGRQPALTAALYARTSLRSALPTRPAILACSSANSRAVSVLTSASFCRACANRVDPVFLDARFLSYASSAGKPWGSSLSPDGGTPETESQTEESQNETEGRAPGRITVRRRRVEGGRLRRHVVRVTPEEEVQLASLARRYRVSVPKLLVDSALAGGTEAAAGNATVRRALITELFGLHRLLANVANNVNQMTKVLHVTGGLPPQAGEVLVAARRTAERIDDVIDGLSP
jgi:hypothetical protein